MNWVEARRKLLQLAIGREEDAANAIATGENCAAVQLDEVAEETDAEAEHRPRLVRDEGEDAGRLIAARAASLCVGSGKGGTGKSVVTASLAQLFSSRGRTLVLDADLGVGNAHILQDVSPERSLVDVVEGSVAVRDTLVRCSETIDLIAAGSGVPRMAELSSYEMHLIAHGMEELDREYKHAIVDSAAGVSRQTMTFAEASDVVLIVTTPDLTAMTDAYAFLKVLYQRKPSARTLLVVNRADDEDEAERVRKRICDVCDRFIGRAPRLAGWIPDDPAVTRAVNHRAAVVSAEADSEAARALRILAVRVLEELGRDQPRGLGRLLMRQVGYSSRLA